MAIRNPVGPHVVLTPDQRIFIDGNEVRGVVSVDVSTAMGQPTRIIIELNPASMLYGDPPSETIEDLHAQTVSGPGDTVDISKAIARAQERRQGK